MKVKAVTNLGTNDYPEHPLLDGQVADVGEVIGKLMVARGHAVELPPEPVTVEQPKPDKFQQARQKNITPPSKG